MADGLMRVTCAVCGRLFELEDAVGSEEYEGWAYFLCSEGCHHRFLQRPERYAGRGPRRGNVSPESAGRPTASTAGVATKHASKGATMSAYVFLVKGMTCQSCVNTVTHAVQRAVPDAKIAIDLPSGFVKVEGAPDERQVVDAIENAGFDVAEIRHEA